VQTYTADYTQVKLATMLVSINLPR